VLPLQSPSPPKANRGPAAGPENRRALIAAAREVYAESGLGAPFSAIAKRAGVGQGSLYRHFPDRTSLAVAVFEENVMELEQYIAPDGRTIDDLLDRVVDQAVVSTALIELITADIHDPRVAPLGERFGGMVVRLVARERAAGRINDHVEAADVAMAVGMLATELARADAAERPSVARRAKAIFHRAFAPR
jgi:AcrR family transcriptional regulator